MQSAHERMEAAAETVADWTHVDMDALYREHFPHDVDLHTWRTFCRRKLAEARAAEKRAEHSTQ